MSNLLNKYGARIKSIYIEIKNYGFYHNPSEIEKADSRFIGRSEMRKKLKNLLTRSDTYSGTYLVTGFRGMGKTSFVNQVISDIKNAESISTFWKMFFGYSIAIWISTFFSPQFIIGVSLIVLYLLMNVIIAGDRKNSIEKSVKHIFSVKYITNRLVNIIFYPYVNDKGFHSKKLKLANNTIRIATLIIISNIIFLIISNFYEIDDKGAIYSYRFATSFGALNMYLLLLTPVLHTLKFNKAKYSKVLNSKSSDILNFVIPMLVIIPTLHYLIKLHFGVIIGIVPLLIIIYIFRHDIKSTVHSYINHDEIIPVRINLGKEELSEEDILRLIAYGLKEKYDSIKKNFGYFKRSLWSFGIGLFIYLIALSTYYNNTTYRLVNQWRENSGIIDYFPSQSFNNRTEKAKNSYEYFKDRIASIRKINTTKDKDVNKYRNILAKLTKSKDRIVKKLTDLKKDRTDYDPIIAKEEKALNKINKQIKNVITENSFYYVYKKEFQPKMDNKTIPFIKKITFSVDYLYTFTSFNLTKSLNQIYKNFNKPSNNNNTLSNSLNLNLDDEKPRYNNTLSDSLDLNSDIVFLPFFDYFFLIYLFIFSIIFRWVLRSPIWGVNHNLIYKRLTNLIDNINAAVLEENKNELSIGPNEGITLFNFFRNRNKTKEYPIASAREIEISLLSILADIESIPKVRMRPQLVFILDELDKIQPKESVENEVKETKEYAETEWAKRRQDTIRKILTNLKHFFNTSKAKFVFIAGREMYDAALADISDRDALIGSMFHEIIYIHSFYKDPTDERLSDITSMTELYVCQFLIPDSYRIKQNEKEFEYNLKNYKEYLDVSFSELSENEKVKIILTLQDFISYISYRSNGAPKKISKIFEEYITSYPSGKENFDSTIFTRGDKRNLYLHFTYNDQYIFTVGKYLFNPFVIAVNKYISQFEDKLLVSTSFLLNHLYKFHKVGFSFKTLELTPEIIAIYKAPELRDFILRLISFMKKTHIRKIISGLYDFRFNSKLGKEISYVSKISEKEAAALNFTLDESLVIKSIFRAQLKKLKKYWGAKREIKYNIESITILYSNLGDLNFNDNQFIEAIHYYKEALLPFKNNKQINIDADTMITYIRIYLKYGLSFEMIKNYDKALLVYDTIYRKSIKFVEQYSKQINWDKNALPRQDAPLITIQRLFYQALIAKLQIIEKSTIKSLTKNQLSSNINSFKNIVNVHLKPEQQFLLKTEYYNKLGDLLFYKNGIVFGKPNGIEENLNDFTKIQYNKKNKEHLFSLPVSGYKYYMIACANLINVGIDEKFSSLVKYFDISKPKKSEKLILHYFTDFLFRGSEKVFPITRRSFYLAAANSLSDAGNTILIIAAAEINNVINSENTYKSKILTELFNIEKLEQIFSFNLKGEYSYDSFSKNDNNIDNNHIRTIYKRIAEIKITYDGISEQLRKELNKLSNNIQNLIFKREKEAINNKHDNLTAEYNNKLFILLNRLIIIVNSTGFSSNYIINKINNVRNEFVNNYKDYYQLKQKEIIINPTAKEAIELEIVEHKNNLSLFNSASSIFNNHIIDRINNNDNKILGEKLSSLNRFHVALRYFIVSGGYFIKSGEYKEFVFQLTKFLQIFRVLIPELKKKGINIENKKLLNLIKKEIVEKAIRNNFKSYQNHNSYEMNKLLKALNLSENSKEFNSIIKSSTSAAEDIKELIILYKELEILLVKDVKYRIEDNIITPYISSSLESNRLHQLNYKNHYNFEILRQMIVENKQNDFLTKTVLTKEKAYEIIDHIYQSNTPIEELEFVILDSLFSLFKMHKSIHIFGISYIHNHSWYASIFKRIGFWSNLFDAFVSISDNFLDSKEKLKKLIGKVEMDDLDPLSYYEKALDSSYKIYESHFEGEVYYDLISEMNYLDDDFNDSLNHFSATIERMVINLGIIERNIKGINDAIKIKMNANKLSEYDIDSYI